MYSVLTELEKLGPARLSGPYHQALSILNKRNRAVAAAQVPGGDPKNSHTHTNLSRQNEVMISAVAVDIQRHSARKGLGHDN